MAGNIVDGSVNESGGTLSKVRCRTRFWLKRVGLLLAATCIGLLFAEFAARGLQLALPVYPQSETAIVLYYDDPNEPVSLTPNWEGYVSGCWAKINSQGFRDREFDAEASPGTCRIVAIGDSYTMGDGVSLDDTYPKQLESLLHNSRDCEVINCGTSATNSTQQLGILRRALAEYHPQLVTLGYNINDFHWYTQTRFERLTEAGYSFQVEPDGLVRMLPRGFTRWQHAKQSVADRSYLYRWLSRIKNQFQSTGKFGQEFD